MFLLFSVLTLLLTCAHAGRPGRYYSRCYPQPSTSTHGYLVTDIYNSRTVNVSSLTYGSFSLVVNVATYCRLTRHYLQMNRLLEDIPNLTILAFPCDQFGHQEPGVNSTEILHGLKHVRPGGGFEPHERLIMLLKGDVNGNKEAELYKYLKHSCPQPSLAMFKSRESFWDPIRVNDISWNFEKFLISDKGVPLYRFHPNVPPSSIQPIIDVLNKPGEIPATHFDQLTTLLNQLDVNLDGQYRP
ncbi:Epididymal secretory glutathione peroxidase [Bulinus truncatus]|nr:Epididymal secretory glutathione peroxidase [Bulinus truncatus]